MFGRGRSLLGGLVVGVFLAYLLIAPGAVASAAPNAVPNAGPAAGTTQWAYGGGKSISASGIAAGGNATYSLSATYGWNTILSQQNGSHGSLEVEVNRTVGATLTAEYCRPNCTAATRSLNISERVWETVVAFANFTPSATVYNAGTAVPAIGLENSSIQEKANLTESGNAVVSTLHGKVTASEHLTVASSGSASVNFQPALGLFPLELSRSPWNSSAAYSATGSWLVSTWFDSTSFLGVHQAVAHQYPGGFAGIGGIVTLTGSSYGAEELNGGLPTTQVGIAVTGPFTTWEGFLLVPNTSDLLASSQAPWSSSSCGSQLASTQLIDLDHGPSSGHFPVRASAALYQPGVSDTGPVSLNSRLTTALGSSPPIGNGSATPTDGPAASTIQAQPESVATAQQSSHCLIAVCGSGAGSSVFGRGVWVLAGAAVAAVLVAALVIAKRQPPRRDPPSRNAALYPPVGLRPPTTPPKENGNGKPIVGPDPTDPLGNLW